MMTVHNPVTSTALEVKHVSKKFGSFDALVDTSLSVRRGEILTLLGPSGSGKSTLLKIIAGFESESSGEIFLDGREILDLPPPKRNIGMVFQNYALFPHMTVAQNIAFPLRMRNIDRETVQEKVARVLDVVDLAPFKDRFPKQLSGGQQQRVALGRAIVFDPPLLLLDEPFSALDRRLRVAMQLELKRLQAQLGLTTIFVTHDQEEALILSDKIAVMNQGSIQQVGTPKEIYARPKSNFVASFVGECNLISGRVVKQDAEIATLLIAQAEVEVPTTNKTVGEEAIIAIRPERLRVALNTQAGNGYLQGTIEEAVYLGYGWRYQIHQDNGEPLVVRVYATDREFNVGDDVQVTWDSDDCQVLK